MHLCHATSVPHAALSDLAHALNDLYRLSSSPRFHEQTVAATGVSVSRTGLRFLSMVADAGPISATRMAEALDLSQPTASRVLQSLETSGLVTREASSSDGRVSHYRVTAAGRRALDAVHRYHVSQLATALGDLPASRQGALSTAVTDLVRRLHPAPAAPARSA